jgi:DNA polymerase III gamma/tau subunit
VSPDLPALHVKYRPTKFGEVLGNKSLIDRLKTMIKKREQQAYLLASTLPGVGKTTLARLSAQQAGCVPSNVIEIAAADFTGVDDMREIRKKIQFEPFGPSKTRAYIFDECHRLSAQAWDCMLKDVEEPPRDLYWFFCTTNVGKVPAAIRSRCQVFNLKEVDPKSLTELVEYVAGKEGIDLHPDVARLLVSEAKGSPRQALVNLDLCRHAKTKKEAAGLLSSAQASEPTRELCQFLLKSNGRTWANAMKIVAKLDKENAEGIRIQVCNYMAAVLRSEPDPRFVLDILDAFSTPYNPSENYAPLLLSLGQVIYMQE